MDDSEQPEPAPTPTPRKLKLVPPPRSGALAGRQSGRKANKLMARAALSDENLALQERLLERDEQLMQLSQQYNSLGAVLHAIVLRHGKQTFSAEALNTECTLAAIRWGREGVDRITLDLAVADVPPEGKVT